MLAEALVYALSRRATPEPFQPHLSDAIGLWARGRRQRRAWQPHLDRSRAAIGHAMGQVEGRGTVAVLGSGPLFDVPLEALAEGFAQVLLVDRAHLFGAQRRVRRHANAELQWRDLSAATQPAPLAFLRDIADLDWVISVNLLSQLAHGAPEDAERRVVDAHLAALATLACPAMLVTDFAYERLDREGRTLEHFDLLYGRSLPRPDEQWTWEVAPFGEESGKSRRVHGVAAYADWRQAARRQAGLTERPSFGPH